MLSSNDLINNYNSYTSYMASTAGMIGEFCGTYEENAKQWFEESVNFLFSFKLCETDIVRIIVLSLKKEARVWFVQTRIKIDEVSLEEFEKLFLDRFSSEYSNYSDLKNFLNFQVPKNFNDFVDLMNCANRLYLNKYLEKESILQYLIKRVPVALRSIVWMARDKGSWLESFSSIMKISSGCFFDNNTENIEIRRVERNLKMKFYKIH